MEAGRRDAQILPFPRPARRPGPVADLRFRTLVGEEGWARLPEAVRARFGKHLGNGRTVVYAGEVVECRISRAGWLLAQLARIVGAPLPLRRDAWVPAVVTVTEDRASGGQLWTRVYGCARGFPQAIHSAKRFCGPTGLEEYIGRGIGIALRVAVEDGTLHFHSDHYFLSVGGRRLRLPRWLSPGRMKVSHIDCNHGWFAFVLRLDHPLLGELVCQTALFEERVSPDGDGW